MIEYPKLLALDLATTFGWALSRDWGVPLSGFVELPSPVGANCGKLLRDFRAWLRGQCVVDRPDRVYVEAPIPEHSSVMAARILLGLTGLCQEICDERGVSYQERASSTARKAFTGKGNSDKDAVGAECRRRGWEIWQPDQCDAACLVHLARTECYPKAEQPEFALRMVQ